MYKAIFALIAAVSTVFSGTLIGRAFVGPGGGGGVGSGAIATDAQSNIGVGIGSTLSDTRLAVKGMNTSTTAYVFKALQPDNTVIFSVRNDGTVSTPGTISAGGFSGPMTGTMNAGNVSAGQFGANTGGGNYGFPSSVSVGSTTAPGATLSVFAPDNSGDAYALEIRNSDDTNLFKIANNGDVDIGSAKYTPGELAITGNISLTNSADRMIYMPNPTAGSSNALTVKAGDAAGNGGFTRHGGTLNLVGGNGSGSGKGGTVYIYGGLPGTGTTGNVVLAMLSGGTARGKVGIGTTTPAYLLDVAGSIRSSSGGYVFPDGTVQTTAAAGASSRTLKTDFRPVSGDAYLTALSSLSITSWRYKDGAFRFAGPVAEDFYAAFGLGDDKTIAPANLASVGLVAIKELIAHNQEQENEIKALRSEINELKRLTGNH